MPLTGENNLLNSTLILKAKKEKEMVTVLEKIENLFCFVFKKTNAFETIDKGQSFKMFSLVR